MALIDYKIKRLSHEKRHVTVDISVYRGAFQDVSYFDPILNETVITPNVYVRIAKVRDITMEYDVPKEMTRQEFFEKAQAYINNKILALADKGGHTVIEVQRDVSKLEAVTNEKEI